MTDGTGPIAFPTAKGKAIRSLGKFPLTRASDVEPLPEPFLWLPYIPREEVTIVEGDPGTGKSFMLLAVCAWLTRGIALPTQETLPPLNAIYLGTEDPPRRLRARLEMMGANLNRIVLLPDDGWDWTINKVSVLKSLIRKVDASIIVIDPLMDFWPEGADTYRQEEVRPLMSGLAKVARDTGSAVVVVRHWIKGQDVPGQHKGAGSVGFSARARSVIAVQPCGSHEGQSFASYELIKTNLGRRGVQRYFSLGDKGFFWYDELPEEMAAGIKERKLWGRLGKLMMALQASPTKQLSKGEVRQATGWVNMKTFRNRIAEGQKLGVIVVEGDMVKLAEGVES